MKTWLFLFVLGTTVLMPPGDMAGKAGSRHNDTAYNAAHRYNVQKAMNAEEQTQPQHYKQEAGETATFPDSLVHMLDIAECKTADLQELQTRIDAARCQATK